MSDDTPYGPARTQDPPEFIQPTDITRMSDADLRNHLDGIRTRRLAGVKRYEAVLAMKTQVKNDKIEGRIAKLTARYDKQLQLIDKHIDKLEETINKIGAERLQLL